MKIQNYCLTIALTYIVANLNFLKAHVQIFKFILSHEQARVLIQLWWLGGRGAALHSGESQFPISVDQSPLEAWYRLS